MPLTVTKQGEDITHLRARIESLEQLAKEMAEALEEQSQVTFECQMVDIHACCDSSERNGHEHDCAVMKALSRYHEVCGGEK